jgi:hypothetical protein
MHCSRSSRCCSSSWSCQTALGTTCSQPWYQCSRSRQS